MTALLVAQAPACEFLDIENPASIELDELDTVAGAGALLNGAEWSVSQALGRVIATSGTVSDELVWAGTRQVYDQLDRGFVTDPTNQAIDETFKDLARARWSAEQALDANPTSARASLYLATTLLLIVENFDDFVLPPGLEPVPSVGADRMSDLLDRAETVLTGGLTTSTEADQASVAALRARVHHARSVWSKLNPSGSTPADPLASSAQAADDARAVLALEPGDWAWSFVYADGTTGPSNIASLLGTQVQLGPSYVTLDPNGPGGVEAAILLDPIDGSPDATLAARVTEFAGVRHPALTVVSSREMRLIVAEHALTLGDTAAFRTEIDALRAMDGKPPYEGQVAAVTLLEHERRVQLFLQGRRWLDHYRFGNAADSWEPTSDAAQVPGILFPIGESERVANPFLGGAP